MCFNPKRKIRTQLVLPQPETEQSLSCVQNEGQPSSVLASLTEGIADIDTVKAATTRTTEKRIFFEDVKEDKTNLEGTAVRHLTLYADYWRRKFST
jgi:hypothetical protein